MSTRNPMVSVIVPAWNSERFLGEAVESVYRQGYQRLEVIVVDDGSTDATGRIARGLGSRVVYRRQRNGGPASARNAGLALARGDVVAFLDADDLWPPGKLSCQLDALWADSDTDVVIGCTQPLRLRTTRGGGSVFDNFLQPRVYLQLGSAIFRRRVFESVGPFDAGLRSSEDIDWFLRARERRSSIEVIEKVTLLHRLHSGNMTRGSTPRELAMLQVLKNSLDRRRASGDVLLEALRGFHRCGDKET